jgi:hypothetical protein
MGNHHLIEAAEQVASAAAHLLTQARLGAFRQGIADEWKQARLRERARVAGLVRCVFGDPFSPPGTADPAWLAWEGGLVVKLARSIYDSQQVEDLPVLADALVDAGCGDEEMLGHLRSPGPHARVSRPGLAAEEIVTDFQETVRWAWTSSP